MEQLETKQVQDLASILAKVLPQNIPADLNLQHRRRLEIAIRTHLGQSQAEICEAIGCSKDTARYWMAIAKTEKADSWREGLVGRPKVVNEEYLERLRELVTHSPQDYGYSFERWTARWLSQHLARELGIVISDRHVNRLLKQMGLSTRNSGKSQPNRQGRNLSTQPTIKIEDLNPSSLSLADDLLW